MEIEEILTLAETAQYLKLSEKTILKLVKNREIPCAKVANQWRFTRSVLNDWLISQMQVVPQNDFSRLIEKELDSVPLNRLMQENTIIMGLHGTNKEEIIQELAKHCVENKLAVDETHLTKKLLEREELTTTALGRGVAIPHIRKPSTSIINEPRIVIAVSRKGIDFGAHDGSPTYLFFLILSDSEVVHLKVLSRLTGILHNQKNVEKMLGFKTPKEFIAFFIQKDQSNGEKL